MNVQPPVVALLIALFCVGTDGLAASDPPAAVPAGESPAAAPVEDAPAAKLPAVLEEAKTVVRAVYKEPEEPKPAPAPQTEESAPARTLASLSALSGEQRKERLRAIAGWEIEAAKERRSMAAAIAFDAMVGSVREETVAAELKVWTGEQRAGEIRQALKEADFDLLRALTVGMVQQQELYAQLKGDLVLQSAVARPVREKVTGLVDDMLDEARTSHAKMIRYVLTTLPADWTTRKNGDKRAGDLSLPLSPEARSALSDDDAVPSK